MMLCIEYILQRLEKEMDMLDKLSTCNYRPMKVNLIVISEDSLLRQSLPSLFFSSTCPITKFRKIFYLFKQILS